MKRVNVVLIVLLVLLAGGLLTPQVEAEPAKANAKQVAKKKVRKARLWFPYSKVQGLSDDQRVEITVIRTEIKAKIAALKKEETERVMAVLTAEQQQQAAAAVAAKKQADAARKKKKAAERAAKKKAGEAVGE